MHNIRKLTMISGAIFSVAAVGYAAPASAQATRTWVSGVGDDANPCSRTAPCKTFAGAISKTAAGGEINCLDPGGFGGVTITKALSIVCDYTEGGILSAGAGVNGIVINAPATAAVFLSGLDLHGAGNAQNGIRIIAGGSVHIQNSNIRAYQASNGFGISFQPSAGTQLTVENTTIGSNGNLGTGGGMLIQPTGAGGNARVTLNNVRFQNNANNALLINTTGATNSAGIIVTIEHSEFVGSGNGINVNVPVGTTGVAVMLNNSDVSHNTTGLIASGASAVMRVGNTTIHNNATGVSPAGGSTIWSYLNNRLDGNGADGTFTPPAQTEE